MNTKNQHRLGLRRGRKVRTRFKYRALVKIGVGGCGLIGVYLLLKLIFPSIAGLLDGLFAGLIERVTRAQDED